LQHGRLRQVPAELPNESVTSTRKRLNKPGIFRRVTQRLANFAHSGGHAVFEVDKRVRLPQGATHFVPGYHLSGILNQQRQQLERLRLQSDSSPIFAQFSGAQV
jgi:hypothetical protein